MTKCAHLFKYYPNNLRQVKAQVR